MDFKMPLLSLPNGFPTEIWTEASPRREHLPQEPWFLVGDSKIKQLWQAWTPSLPLGELWLDVSEQKKSMAEVLTCLEVWSQMQLSRQVVIVCVGGGVLSDLVGLATSLYQRGLRWHIWPTTLVAQVDASIGGKTAVNLGEAKNQIGSFYPPARVVICNDFLKTLPSAHLENGQWEIIKMALLEGDADWVASLSGRLGQPSVVASLRADIERSVLAKVAIVHQDLRDQGDRKLLNLGHTVAHAIEAASQFQISHGSAVGFGLLVACTMSSSLDLSDFPPSLIDQWIVQLRSSQLAWPSWDQCAPFLAWDKKKENITGEPSFHEPLPRTGERAILVSCSLQLFEQAYRKVHARF